MRLDLPWSELEQAASSVGLDFDPVIFEVVDWETMAMLAAYGGFPRRYPHWRWGSEYSRQRSTYRYGLSRIYELVVNTNPVYAYLLESNPVLSQKLVVAHVYAHADFFKNNSYFVPIQKSMHNDFANHAAHVEALGERVGVGAVEEFLDLALSLENLIDPHAAYIRRPQGGSEKPKAQRLAVRDYLDSYVNPPVELPQQASEEAKIEPLPARPEQDVLGFLLAHAPLSEWQKALLAIVRDEALYFAPQGMTKIMNEGWATFWHTRILTSGGFVEKSEAIDFAELQAGVLGGGGFNPYQLGYALYRSVARREGDAAIFPLRRIHNDVTFLDSLFDLEFAEAEKIVAPGDEEGFNAIKQKLLGALTNLGRPRIYVLDANYQNRGELLLSHVFEGVELELKKSRATLENVYKLWGRPVRLETVVGGRKLRFSFDGAHHQEVR
jgi:stage V sporulation protein R